MRAFGVQLRRELGALFVSPIAWAAFTFFLVVMGASFWMLLDQLSAGAEATEGGAIISQLLGSIFFWVALWLTVPALTMRLFAEEQRSGTFETLMTAPIRDGEVVLAKYLAALIFYTLLWAATLVYAAALAALAPAGAPMDAGALAVGYLGVLLIGAMALAAGVWVSALTRSQVVAALACFALIFVFFLVGFLPYLPIGATFTRSAHYISGVTHLLDFSRGVLDTRAIAFYLINTAWLLWAAVRTVEARRWT